MAGGALSHTYVLLLKNLFVWKRKWRFMTAFCLSICLPVILAWLMTKLSYGTQLPAGTIYSLQNPLPQCIKFGKGTCYNYRLCGNTTDPDFNTFMHKLSSYGGVPLSTIQTCSDIDMDDMVEYFNANLNVTQAGIILSDISTFNYTLFYNSTVVSDVNGWFPGEATSENAAQLQTLVDRILIEINTGITFTKFNIGTRSLSFPKSGFNIGSIVAQIWGVVLLGLTVTIPFVWFLVQVVSEKQRRLRLGMAMMGMQQCEFWAHWIISILILDIIITFVTIITAQICRLNLFVNSNFGVLFIALIIFHMSMIGFAIFVASFVQTTKNATTFGFVYIVAGLFVELFMGSPFFLTAIMTSTTPAVRVVKTLMRLFLPQFSFGAIITTVGAVANPPLDPSQGTAAGYFTWKDVFWTLEYGENSGYFFESVNSSYLWMLLVTLIYSAIGLYIDAVSPGETGVNRPPWFLFTADFWCRKRTRTVTEPDLAFFNELDNDVAQHAKETLATETTADVAVLTQMLVKSYGWNGAVKAVNGVCLTIKRGELFGLLGHNGAGKTTTIGTLVGLHHPSSGRAFINGVDCTDQKARTMIGVCPQHDILWDELSAEEHLTIFARFKGLNKSEIKSEIERLLNQVNLWKVRDRPSCTFSGGMKRRLSVAIANIGNPQVILMDEPTTGMDPHSRRQVWQLIQEMKKSQTILLTTHSMEEADALSDRLAVMVKGQLRCIGSPLHLKTKFGRGYQCRFVCDPARGNELMQFMSEKLPQAQFTAANAGSYIFQLEAQHKGALPGLVGTLESMKATTEHPGQRLIKEWGVSQTTLEEVYININAQFHVYNTEPMQQQVEQETATEEGHRIHVCIHVVPPHEVPVAQARHVGTEFTPKPNQKIESRPFKALYRKQMSFQKRQPFGVCCMVVLPVIIAILLIVLRYIIPHSNTPAVPAMPIVIPTWNGMIFGNNVEYPNPFTNLDASWFAVTGGAQNEFGVDTVQNGVSNTTMPGSFMREFTRVLLNNDDTMLRGYANPYNGLYYPYWQSVSELSALDSNTYSTASNAIKAYPSNLPNYLNPHVYQQFEPFTSYLTSLPIAGIEVNELVIDFTKQTAAVDVLLLTPVNEWYQSLPNVASQNGNGNGNLGNVRVQMVNAFTTAFVRNVTRNSSTNILAGVWAMPQPEIPYDFSPVSTQVVSYVAPLILIVPIAFFAYHIVFEKENKLREISKMNAMQMKDYWINTLLFDFVQYLAMIFLMIISLAAAQDRWITQTSIVYILLLFIGCALSTIAFSVFISLFINKSTTAMIAGIVLTLLLWVFGSITEVFVYKGKLPFFIQMLIPPLALQHGIMITADMCTFYECVTTSNMFSNMVWGAPIIYLWCTFVMWTLLSLYLDKVLPTSWGVREHPLFCILRVINRRKSAYTSEMQQTDSRQPSTTSEDLDADEDVQQMSLEVRSGKYSTMDTASMAPILIRGLRKIYNTEGFTHTAVKNLDLAIENGTCFGLLGPNGAGKTTTIHMLCGMIEPSAGRAFVSGHDIITNMRQVHLNIGICPQHDIVWAKHLTVEEHLLFVARLKGIPKNAEREHVLYWLGRVNLVEKKERLAGRLSGGELRRLSIAMALVGNPKIVFFDEPTTGLDPTARRMIWNIINEAKVGRCIILTTHSMEEAEVLSDTIGIMAHGKLRCVGSVLHLKSRFGKGFRVTVSFAESRRQDVLSFMASRTAYTESGITIQGQITLEIDPSTCNLGNLCAEIEQQKDTVGILDWALSQTSMEDVFLNIVKVADQETAAVKPIGLQAAATVAPLPSPVGGEPPV